jgi:ATP-dependent protease ClpP protease subunit
MNIPIFTDPSLVVCTLIGEITWDHSQSIILSAMQGLANPEAKAKQVVLFISSNGGELDAAWAISEFLNGLNMPIATVALGKVYSAAIVPFLAGTDRYVSSSSVLLFHPAAMIYDSGQYSIKQLEEEITCHKIDKALFQQLIKDKTVPDTDVNQFSLPDASVFLDAERCLQHGLATQKISNFDDIKIY